MSNKIKCEWCGYHYDETKYESCPKCGGTNSSHFENERVENTYVQKNNSTIKKNRTGVVIFIVLFLIFFVFLFGAIGFFVFTGISPSSNYTFEEEKINSYYTNDIPLEIGTSKFYIPYISFYDSYSDDIFSPSIEFYFEEADYEKHMIEIYLLSGDTKYRVAISDDFIYDGTINSINDMLKSKGSLSVYGIVNKGDNSNLDYKDIDSILLVIDDMEYSLPLTYKETFEGGDREDYEIKYTLSDKISFGEKNSLYIDKLDITNYYSSTKSYAYLKVGTFIEDYSGKKLDFYIEDSSGQKYKLYEDSYFSSADGVIKSKDILKSNLENEALNYYFYSNSNNYSKLIVIIDGVEKEVVLK